MQKPIKFIYALLIITIIGAGVSYELVDKSGEIKDQDFGNLYHLDRPSVRLSTIERKEVCNYIEKGDTGFDIYKLSIPLPIICNINIGYAVTASLEISTNGDITLSQNGNYIFDSTNDSDKGDIVYHNDGLFLDPQYISFLDDINFDGYRDIKLETTTGAYNYRYLYFVYNPKIGKYDEVSLLPELVNPEFDSISRTIHTNDKGRGINDVFTDDTYKFKNGEYLLVQTEIQDIVDYEDPSKGYTNTVKELINGKIVQTSKKHLTEKEVWGR